jgi:hypothetical protein
MLKLIERIEDRVIKSYGFESKRTIMVFQFTELLRKLTGAQ